MGQNTFTPTLAQQGHQKYPNFNHPKQMKTAIAFLLHYLLLVSEKVSDKSVTNPPNYVLS